MENDELQWLSGLLIHVYKECDLKSQQVEHPGRKQSKQLAQRSRCEKSSQISLVLLLCGTCQLAIYLFTWLDYFSCPNPKFYLLTDSSQVHMRTLYRIWNIISMQKPSQILMQYGLQTQPCNIVLVGHGLYINLHGCILIKLVWTLFVTLDRRIFIKSDG